MIHSHCTEPHRQAEVPLHLGYICSLPISLKPIDGPFRFPEHGYVCKLLIKYCVSCFERGVFVDSPLESHGPGRFLFCNTQTLSKHMVPSGWFPQRQKSSSLGIPNSNPTRLSRPLSTSPSPKVFTFVFPPRLKRPQCHLQECNCLLIAADLVIIKRRSGLFISSPPSSIPVLSRLGRTPTSLDDNLLLQS